MSEALSFIKFDEIQPSVDMTKNQEAVRNHKSLKMGNVDQRPGEIANNGERQLITRRAMLSGSAKAMPVILTLQSGAALARSSNLIGAGTTPSFDRKGRLLCLDVRSVYSTRSDRVYDLGEPARARVIAVNDRDLHVLPNQDAARISEARACREGRTVYYVDGEAARATSWNGNDGLTESYVNNSGETVQRHWKSMQVPRGAFVSATALASFAGNISVTDL